MEWFRFGNLSHLKSHSYMEDVAAIQQYFCYLLPDSPIPAMFSTLYKILLIYICIAGP